MSVGASPEGLFGALGPRLLEESYRQVLPVTPPLLPRGRALHKLHQGIPLLHDESISLDLPACRALLGRLLSLMLTDSTLAVIGRSISEAISRGQLDLQRSLEEAAMRHEDHLGRIAEWAGLEPRTLSTLLGLAVRPAMIAIGVHLRPLLAELSNWQVGYCPLCGARPALAELTENAPTIRFRCLYCATGWRLDSCGCPFCREGTLARSSLPPLTPWPDAVLLTCGHCHEYVKAIATELSLTPEQIARIDDATSGLDRLAGASGSIRPPGQGFRIELADEPVDEALDDLLEMD